MANASAACFLFTTEVSSRVLGRRYPETAIRLSRRFRVKKPETREGAAALLFPGGPLAACELAAGWLTGWFARGFGCRLGASHLAASRFGLRNGGLFRRAFRRAFGLATRCLRASRLRRASGGSGGFPGTFC